MAFVADRRKAIPDCRFSPAAEPTARAVVDKCYVKIKNISLELAKKISIGYRV